MTDLNQDAPVPSAPAPSMPDPNMSDSESPPAGAEGASSAANLTARATGDGLERLLAESPTLRRDLAEAQRHYEASLAASTRRVYRIGWDDFEAYCSERGLRALPARPAAVALYLTARARERPTARGAKPSRAGKGLSRSTLKSRVAAIKHYHIKNGYDDPTASADVRGVFAGIRRSPAQRQELPKTQAQPLRSRDIEAIFRVMPGGGPPPPASEGVAARARWLRGVRDRAILLLGLASAMRPIELLSVQTGHIEWRAQGIIIHVPRSKTDQEAAGTRKTVRKAPGRTFCPVGNLGRWLRHAAIDEGPIFRGVRRSAELRPVREVRSEGHIYKVGMTYQALNNMVRKWCGPRGADLTPDRIQGRPRRYSGHSTRAGHITEAGEEGAPEADLLAQSGHRDLESFREYLRPSEELERSSSQYLRLYRWATQHRVREMTPVLDILGLPGASGVTTSHRPTRRPVRLRGCLKN